jgi:hypothetical protein
VIEMGKSTEEQYPEWLRTKEKDLLGIKGSEERPWVGLALSGGGIRSATFALGVLQTLAQRDLLGRVKYLSTVSGGGYIGTFLGAAYHRQKEGAPAAVRKMLTEFPESREMRWLRECGRYLAPTGSSSNWLAGAVLLRNWLTVLLVLAPAAFFLSFLGITLSSLVLYGLRALPAVDSFFPSLLHQHSPLWVLPLLVLLAWALPSGLAYWFINQGHRDSLGPAKLVGIWVLGLGGVGSFALVLHHAQHLEALVLLLGVLVLTALVYLMVARGKPPWVPDTDGIVRNRMSASSRNALLLTVATAVIALCDTLGRAVDRVGFDAVASAIATVASVAGGFILSTHRVLAQLGGDAGQKRPRRLPLGTIATLVGAGLAVFGAGLVSAVSYFLLGKLGTGAWRPGDCHLVGKLCELGIASFIAFVWLFVVAQFPVFVNASSLHPFYAARLTRAYLGATNALRWQASTEMHSLTEPVDGDQVRWQDYGPHEKGGPIHLVNVTVNETVDPRMQEHQPDRKGMTLAVGPVGVSLAVRHHARWPWVQVAERAAGESAEGNFRIFPQEGLVGFERLNVGQWMAISGAAVAPGLGVQTSWGYGFLLGLLNMRLGYWWNSGVERHEGPKVSRPLSSWIIDFIGRAFPVHRFLVAEIMSRFPGTAIPRWYLSDGGHAENTGAYELIRRRLPFVILSDAGADPNADLADLGNLTRLVRVDFGAEIDFLERADLDAVLVPEVARFFGPPCRFKERLCHGALGRITYEGTTDVSWLIVIKPSLVGDEPTDIAHYKSQNDDFPQESTGDQYFDDAQWESYRRLGQLVAGRLFPESVRGQRWHPGRLDSAGFEQLGGIWANRAKGSGSASGAHS